MARVAVRALSRTDAIGWNGAPGLASASDERNKRSKPAPCRPASDRWNGPAAGLLALILLTAARRSARVDPEGHLHLLADQDRGSWDGAAIGRGCELDGHLHDRHSGKGALFGRLAAERRNRRRH